MIRLAVDCEILFTAGAAASCGLSNTQLDPSAAWSANEDAEPRAKEAKRAKSSRP